MRTKRSVASRNTRSNEESLHGTAVSSEETEIMVDSTVHWLRHTRILQDMKFHHWKHVRDEAGHSSNAITDWYIVIELTERHKFAKRKKNRSDK